MKEKDFEVLDTFENIKHGVTKKVQIYRLKNAEKFRILMKILMVHL